VLHEHEPHPLPHHAPAAAAEPPAPGGASVPPAVCRPPGAVHADALGFAAAVE
jgi:hypothetical protein